jgi:fucose permease
MIAGAAGIALSQATLVDAHPGERERIMTRWTFVGELGDLAGPLLIAALASVAIGWRGAYVTVGAVVGVWAILLAWRRFDAVVPPRDASVEEGESPGVWGALSSALRNRTLLVWLLGTALCDLLDEIFVVFASLHLRDALGATVTERSVVLAADVIGSAVGLAVAERLLRRMPPLRLLAISAGLCGATLAAWILAPTVWLCALAALALGAATAPLYPISAAQAYAAMPGRSGTVNAAGHLFTPMTLALPWLLGVVADRFGATGALWLLLVQPAGLLVIVVTAARRRPASG